MIPKDSDMMNKVTNSKADFTSNLDYLHHGNDLLLPPIPQTNKLVRTSVRNISETPITGECGHV